MVFFDNKKHTVGKYLRLLRTEKEMSLRQVSEETGISENFLSEIERDKKSPNDDFIKKLAICYGIDEKELFDKFGRIPLTTQEEIKDREELNDFLYDFANSGLNDEEKEILIGKIRTLYETHKRK